MVQTLKQRYLIIRKLGQGGMGVVYEAKDINLDDRFVAVKEMTQHNLSQQEIIAASQAFKQEANMLAKLHHPNLPSIHDYFEEAGHWYLVMEFIKGETLEEYLVSQGRKLPLKEVLDIGIQLCTVLEYLHTRQPAIIFRDLKPLNIMHTNDGHIYLIDFGIARHFKPGQARDTAVAYSRGFAAPEQHGEAQTTIHSDIYSLGATLHYLITGIHPAQAPFRFAPLQSKGQPGLDRLNSLIIQMVAMDASTRPTSMAAVKKELQRVLADNNQSLPSPPKPNNYQPQSSIAYSPTPVQIATPRQRTSPSSSIGYTIGTEPIVETTKDRRTIWEIGVRQVVFMALGAALYAGVSYATNSLQLPGASNVSLRPGIVIPVFFGAVFGPWVGLFAGGVGNLINDLLTGPIYWNWDLGNGLIGFVSGLAMYLTLGRYRSIRNIVIGEVFGVLGIIIGLGFAAYSDIWVSALTPLGATTTEFIPATVPDIILSLILLPILLVAYNAAVGRSGRT